MNGAGLRVRVLSALLWVAIAAGPVLGGAALLRTPPPSEGSVADAPTPPGLIGTAELAVIAYLTAAPGSTRAPWGSPALPGLRPRGSVLDGLSADERPDAVRAGGTSVAAASAVAIEPAGPDRWGVTVAVLRGTAVEGWQVTVAASGEGLLVESLPALVGLPAHAAPPVPLIGPLRTPPADDPVATAVQRFLAALLTGDGELSRYLAPGSVVAVPAAVGERVALRRLSTGALDDRRLIALAEVQLLRADGAVHVMQYPLLLVPTDGRWEVARLLPALPVRPQTGTPEEP